MADERAAERPAERTAEGEGPVLNLAAVRESLSDAARILSELGPEPAGDEEND